MNLALMMKTCMPFQAWLTLLSSQDPQAKRLSSRKAAAQRSNSAMEGSLGASGGPLCLPV